MTNKSNLSAVTDYTIFTLDELVAMCTIREAAFAREYALCANGTKAMEAVAKNLKLTITRPDVAASKLKKRPRVKALIRKMGEEAAEAVGMTKASQLHDLQKIKINATKEGNHSAAVAAAAEQNRMLGWHAPVKVADADGGSLQPVTAVQVNIVNVPSPSPPAQ